MGAIHSYFYGRARFNAPPSSESNTNIVRNSDRFNIVNKNIIKKKLNAQVNTQITRNSDRFKMTKKKKQKAKRFDPLSAHNIARWGGKFGAPSIRKDGM